MQQRMLPFHPVAFAFLGALLLVIVLSFDSSGELITVDADGGADHLTIQEAIDASQPGDTIQVSEGTYEESVLVDKELTIMGNDRSSVIVDGGGGGIPFKLQADGITLSGFTVRNGFPTGIEIRASDILVEDCDISTCVDGIRTSIDRELGPLDEILNTTFGGSADDTLKSAAPTTDGGYIILSTSRSYGGSDKDYWLVKLDRSGDVEWEQVIDTESNDEAVDVLPTSDGGYLLSGYNDNGENNYYVVKTDGNGGVEWDREYNSGTYERPYGGSIEVENGSFIIAGYTIPPGESQAQAYLLKIDNSGNEIWDSNFGLSDIETLWDVTELPDKDLLSVGYTKSSGEGGEDAYIIRTNENGKRVWDTNFGSSGNDRFRTVIIDEDRFIGVGFASTLTREKDAWVMRFDGNGNKIEERFFGGSEDDYFDAIVPTEDGGYILSGRTFSYGHGDSDSWVIKLDNELKELWNISVGGSGYEGGIVMPLMNDTLTTFSRTESYGSGGTDSWMLTFPYRDVQDSIRIANCTISSNQNNGIHVPFATHLVIEDCSIQNNEGSGIYLMDLKNAKVVNNSLTDNQISGLQLMNGDLCTIALNTLQRNKGSGLSLLERSYLNTIIFNNISQNEIGILVQNSSSLNEIHQNHIEKNVIYGVSAEANEGVVVDAIHNWWGSINGPHHTTLNPNEEGDSISDNVDYDPWLTRPTDNISPELSQFGITPEVQLLGEEVMFTASGSVYGAISGYSMRSDIDGEFYNGSVSYHNTSSLSQGHHLIYFKVKDHFGDWSPEVNGTLIVHTRPMVVIDDTIKKEIVEGDDIRLFCNASDDGEVVRYVWASSEDGTLYDGPDPEFLISNLSAGDHDISVRVLDNYAVWSEIDEMTVKVEEKQLFIFDEIGPFQIIHYLALIAIILLISVITLVIIVKKKRSKTNSSPPQQGWPAMQAQQTQSPGSGQTTPGQPAIGQPSHPSQPYQPPSSSPPTQSSDPHAMIPPSDPHMASPSPRFDTPRTITSPNPPSPPGGNPFIITCPGCGKTANAAWTNCLKCGIQLK